MEWIVNRVIDDGENVVHHSDDILEHHGILGMKWGVRRYQNKDGSWTKEGKARRIKNNSSKFTDSDKKTMRNYDKELLEETERYGERGQKAASLGLRALHEMGYDVGADEYKNKRALDWFLREDQTVGFTEMADMVNRGKSADDIKNMVSDINEKYRKWVFDNEAQNSYTPSRSIENIYEGTNAGRNKSYIEFVETCSKLKDRN